MSEVLGQKPLTPPVLDHRDVEIIRLKDRIEKLEDQLDTDVQLSVARYKRIGLLEAGIREIEGNYWLHSELKKKCGKLLDPAGDRQ